MKGKAVQTVFAAELATSIGNEPGGHAKHDAMTPAPRAAGGGDQATLFEQPWYRSLRHRADAVDTAHVMPGDLRPRVLRRRVIQRKRIAAAMSIAGARLVIVTGPAGAGKSTSLCLWASRWHNDHIGWLSLDDQHNSRDQLLRSLVAAGAVAGAVDLLPPSSIDECTDIDLTISSLVGALADVPERVALVVDDAHVLRNEAAVNVLVSFLRQCPPNVKVMLSSRGRLPRGLAGRIAIGDVSEIGADELAFDPGETARVLDLAGRLASPRLAHDLWSATGGWTALVTLAIHATRTTEQLEALLERNLETHRWFADFVSDELLSHVPDDLRSFMVDIAILDDLDPELCNATRGVRDSPRHLQSLDEMGLLIELEDVRARYRLHHLAKQMLRRHLGSGGLPTETLHLNAARWFDAGGHHHDAVTHALDAGRADLATQYLIPALQKMQVPAGDEMWWFDRLSDDELRSRPGLLAEVAIFVRLVGAPEQHARFDRLVEGCDQADASDCALLGIDWGDLLERDIGRAEQTLDSLIGTGTATPTLWAGWIPTLSVVTKVAQDKTEAALLTIRSELESGRRSTDRRSMLAWYSVVSHRSGDEQQADRFGQELGTLSATSVFDTPVEWARALRAEREGDRDASDAHFRNAIALVPHNSWYRDLLALDHVRSMLASGATANAGAMLTECRRRLDSMANAGALETRIQQLGELVGVPVVADERLGVAHRLGVSQRELEVLACVLDGRSSSEIAGHLYIAPSTVKSHVRSIMRCVGVTRRTDIAAVLERQTYRYPPIEGWVS